MSLLKRKQTPQCPIWGFGPISAAAETAARYHLWQRHYHEPVAEAEEANEAALQKIRDNFRVNQNLIPSVNFSRIVAHIMVKIPGPYQ